MRHLQEQNKGDEFGTHTHTHTRARGTRQQKQQHCDSNDAWKGPQMAKWRNAIRFLFPSWQRGPEGVDCAGQRNLLSIESKPSNRTPQAQIGSTCKWPNMSPTSFTSTGTGPRTWPGGAHGCIGLGLLQWFEDKVWAWLMPSMPRAPEGKAKATCTPMATGTWQRVDLPDEALGVSSEIGLPFPANPQMHRIPPPPRQRKKGKKHTLIFSKARRKMQVKLGW